MKVSIEKAAPPHFTKFRFLNTLRNELDWVVFALIRICTKEFEFLDLVDFWVQHSQWKLSHCIRMIRWYWKHSRLCDNSLMDSFSPAPVRFFKMRLFLGRVIKEVFFMTHLSWAPALLCPLEGPQRRLKERSSPAVSHKRKPASRACPPVPSTPEASVRSLERYCFAPLFRVSLDFFWFLSKFNFMKQSKKYQIRKILRSQPESSPDTYEGGGEREKRNKQVLFVPLLPFLSMGF